MNFINPALFQTNMFNNNLTNIFKNKVNINLINSNNFNLTANNNFHGIPPYTLPTMFPNINNMMPMNQNFIRPRQGGPNDNSKKSKIEKKDEKNILPNSMLNYIYGGQVIVS